MPTMKGGGDTGEECIAVASANWQLLHWLFSAMAGRETVSPVLSRTTQPPSKVSSSAAHPRTSAAMAHNRSFSCAHAFSTAMPVTYVVEDA